MNLHTFTTEKEWISAVVAETFSDIADDISLAFSGGSTPAPVYRALAAEKKDWEKADIFVVDERFVPPSHHHSNEKLIRENFVAPAHFHFWETEHLLWKESAKKYNILLKKQEKKIDVLFLGMGPDGHTASLFPHSPALTEKEKMATTTTTDIFAVHKRLTMTFPAIFSAKKIILLLKGNNKKEVLHELICGKKTTEEFPAKKLLEHKNFYIFFADI